MRIPAAVACVFLAFGCAGNDGPGSPSTDDDVPEPTGGEIAIEVGPATDAIVTIVTLGDSLTDGVGDSVWTDAGGPLGFPGRLEARLRARGADAVVENVGRSGWTSSDLVQGVDWGDAPEPSQLSLAVPILEGAAADGRKAVATVWIGSNDLFGVYGWCHEPDNTACEADNLAEYTANLDTTLAQLTATGATVLVALLDDQSRRPVLTDPAFADSFPNIGAPERALMSAQVARYNDAVANLATKHGATPVDFFHTTIFEEPATLAEDGNHPNAAGYEAVTSIWESSLGAALGL